MPSSISSSERPIPGGDWRTTWLVAIVCALGLVILCELVARSAGQRPNVVDDPVWWSLSRREVRDDPAVVAFVGTSRLQLAYSADAFAAAAPNKRGVQLAINGVPAIRILEDLANDPSFRGTAVVDLDEWDIAWGDPYNSAKPYVERARSLWRAPGALANRLLGSYVQERVAVLATTGRAFMSGLLQRRWAKPSWVVADRDRISRGRYSLAEPRALQQKADKRLSNFDTPALPAEQWVANALAIEPHVRAIRARGGDVLVVRVPVSGRLAELFERHYPKARYWDAFAAQTSARTLHFRDVPALRDILCPDEMHLDERDQPAFTRAVADALSAR